MALGAWATSITVERIGGRGGASKTTVTSSFSAIAQRSSRSTSRTIAAWRSRHHWSGRVPITFMPSTSQCIADEVSRARAGLDGTREIKKRPAEASRFQEERCVYVVML